jgi:Zn-dependent protease
MSLLMPEPTKYDLAFRLFGIPLRISAWFWVVHLGLGILSSLFLGLAWILIWPAIALISVLIHELGHVLVGRMYGSRGEIVLTPFGGLAGGAAELDKREYRIIVYCAGPAAQLVFAVVLSLVFQTWLQEWFMNRLAAKVTAGHSVEMHYLFLLLAAFYALIGMNIFSAIFNLIPVPPLDGGKILEEVLGRFPSGGRSPWEHDADWWKR